MNVAQQEQPQPVSQVINYPTREAWLAARKAGIGASESAALFSLSPWESPFSLWAKKTEKFQVLDGDSERMEAGRLMEPVIAGLYEKRFPGRRLWSAGDYAIASHPGVPCMYATPDRWISEAPDRPGLGLVEIKNSAAGDLWDQGPPMHVQVQVQHQMAVTGRDWVSVAAFISGWDLRVFDIERDDAFIVELEARCDEFWRRHVMADTPPDVDGHTASLETLKRLHPLDNGQTIDLGADALVWWTELEQVKASMAELSRRKDELYAQITNAIGPNTFGRLPDDRLLSYKHATKAAFQVKEQTSRTLREVKGGGARKPPKGKRT